MKILKIFGVVVAVHAAVFMFVFAIPGCRSTTRQTPPNVADTAASPTSVSYPGGSSSGPVFTGGADASPSIADSELNPGIYPGGGADAQGDSSGSPVVRYNPTRPDTPVAGALKGGAVGGVTPATTYTVAKGDSFWKIAKKHHLTVSELAAANNLKSHATLRVGQKLIIPGKAPGAASEQGPGSGSSDTTTYEVRPGDNLATIARRAGTTVSVLRSLNHLPNDNLRAGQEILLPAGSKAAATSRESSSARSQAKASGGAKHVVKSGESLSQIARRYGVPLRDIAAANNIANPGSLRAGQELTIPGARQSEPAVQPAPAVEEAPAPVAAPEENPIAPAPEAAPVAPASEGEAGEAAPPVIQVDEQGPVAPAGN